MQALLFVDLVSGALSGSLGGPAFSWPKLIQGDDLTLSLRLSESLNGQTVETSRVVQGLKATLGNVDARPISGAVKLKVGSATSVQGVNVTDPIQFDATAEQVAAALNALSGGFSSGQNPVTVIARDGSHLIQAADDTALELSIADNTLWPVSFGRLRQYDFDGASIHELRFMQTPVAFTSSFARVVPEAPSISEVQDGGTNESTRWNEVQKLIVPAAFRGTYYLQRGFKKSSLLSPQDGPDEIAAALAGLADEGGQFKVTNPLPQAAHIEFAGSMAGQSFPNLEVHVGDAPEGDLRLTLSLATNALDKLLEGSGGSAKLQLEIEATVQDGSDLRVLTLFRGEVIVQSELTFEELDALQAIDWTQPPLPKDYVPFTVDQVNSGMLHYATALGNGIARAFVITHNLDSALVHVVIMKQADGHVLNAAEDYTVQINSANQLTITLDDAFATPASAGLAAAVLAMGAASQFNPHTHTIAQIVNLQTILDDLGGRLTTVEERLGLSVLATPPAGQLPPGVVWKLPKVAEIFGVRGSPDNIGKDLISVDTSTLNAKGGGLFAAIHADPASPTNLPVPLTPGATGTLYKNVSGADVVLPGGYSHKTRSVAADGFAGWDGRMWYEVARFGSEKSFYPTDFDRELFFLAVNDAELRPGFMLELFFGLELGLFKSDSKAQYVLVIEHGSFSEDTSPATTGQNIAAINWNATPLLSQRLILTEVPVTRTFGCRIKRAIDNSITSQRIVFGAEAGGDSAPVSANFALRARLTRFDTEDSKVKPRGFIGILGLDKSDDDTAPSTALGRATVKPIA